ncbi:unnamed protein product [Penicillium roqueforti FM164]|uniref:Uncharacterized protein n=1 Tax=Penicillium roqueforti (strain FM164) TaxID=1365484 RepID=W6QNS1_PENRF|nr:unnamed protein product [Penicillium roqueforti FM164]
MHLIASRSLERMEVQREPLSIPMDYPGRRAVTIVYGFPTARSGSQLPVC